MTVSPIDSEEPLARRSTKGGLSAEQEMEIRKYALTSALQGASANIQAEYAVTRAQVFEKYLRGEKP